MAAPDELVQTVPSPDAHDQGDEELVVRGLDDPVRARRSVLR